MPYDEKERRKSMLAHCINLIDRAGKEYALWAAGDYESKSEGVLQGLRARIVKEIEKRRIDDRTSPAVAPKRPKPERKAALGAEKQAGKGLSP